MQCGGSRVAAGNQKPAASEDATDESTLAHNLAFYWLNNFNADIAPGMNIGNQIISNKMIYYVNKYVTALKNEYGFDKSLIAKNFAIQLPEIECTLVAQPDCVTFADDWLHIDNLHYGWTLVEPEFNWNMIGAALALYGQHYNEMRRVQNIRVRIHQPRQYHPKGDVREWVFNRADLDAHRSTIVNAIARTGELRTGPECLNCPANTKCPAARKVTGRALDIIEQYHVDDVSNEQLAQELATLEDAEKVLKARKKALEETATHALKKGGYIPGYYLGSVNSRLTWNDGVTADQIKVLTGVAVETEEIKMTPTQALEAGANEVMMKILSHRPNGGQKLVKGEITEKLKNGSN